MIVVHIDTLAKRYPSGKIFEIAEELPGLLGRIDTTSNAYAFAGADAFVVAAVPLVACPIAIPQLINPTIQIFAIIACASRRIVRFVFIAADLCVKNRAIWAIFTLQTAKSG
jgi:hypothetical protein